MAAKKEAKKSEPTLTERVERLEYAVRSGLNIDLEPAEEPEAAEDEG